MGTNQQFSLRWNNHTNNILQVFLEQFSSEALVDVTLSCEGQFLRAHKMVLSACSPYFQELFQVHEVQHPVIIMNGMKFNDIKQIIEFMYKGEVKVLEAELSGLLAAAESLQVKGLSHVRNKYQKGDIQGADQQATPNSEPPPLEPCVPTSTSTPTPTPTQPTSTPSVSNLTSTQAPVTKPQPAVPPLVPTSVPAAALAPTTQSTKRKKSPEKAENSLKKRNCQTPAQAAPAAPILEKNFSEDEEFPAMIKVEPLDIRDIDEEQPWEPPKLVIDMREGGAKISTVKTFNSARPSLLKIRSAMDLGVPRVDDPLKENDPKKDPLDIKEWRGNKRVTRIPRPPNAFMIFANEWRRKLAMENPNDTTLIQTNLCHFPDSKLYLRMPRLSMTSADSNKEISVRLGIKWKNLTAEKKALYYSASRIADEEHKRKYPNYYYSPKEARIRKSQQQNLRRRFVGERVDNAVSTAAGAADAGKALSPDPLRFVKVFMKDPTTRGVFVAVEGSKTAPGASASTYPTEAEIQENLQEEFLKMVEGGEVEAEVEGDMSGELEGLTEPVEEEEIDGRDEKPLLTESMLMLQKQAEGGKDQASAKDAKVEKESDEV